MLNFTDRSLKMATIDNGFKVGDWCIPESFNIWAKTKESCQVIDEDGRYVMTIRLPDGSTDIVHPYRWKHAEVGADGLGPANRRVE
jgi:hypothetical protein